MNKLHTLGIVAGLSASVVITSSAWAGATTPDDLIRNTAQYVLKTIKNDKDFTKNPTKTTKLIEEKVLPHFNFARMTQLAVGSNWKKATPEERKDLTEQFKILLVRTYSNSLSKYKDHKIEVESAKIVEEEATVKSSIIQPDGKLIHVDYALQKSGDAWKVYDISIENISLVTNYRNQFASLVKTKGIDGLIDSLKEKNGTK